jgi:predicted nucleotidyltransferase
MNNLLKDRKEKVEKLCEKYRVRRLEIFGSAATENFHPDNSDLDFLVEFQTSQEMNAADQYFGLLEDLKILFRRDVDLVMTRAIKNPYFIKEINQTRRTLYEAQDTQAS